MPQRLTFVLLSMLIWCTALGAGLDPIRVGRYSAFVAGPSPEQADPFALLIHTQFSFSVQTVGRALERVLAPSGYRLASVPASCPSLPSLLAWPLPAVHQSLGPMRLDEALKTLAGSAHYLVVDPVHRLVSFELRKEYQALAGGGAPGPVHSTPDLIVLEPLPILALELAAPAGGFGSITATEGSHGTKRIGPIEEGAELWPIAADLSETFDASAEQVMVGLFEANPESFCYQNLNCLKVGAHLDLPSTVATTTPSEARRTLQSHLTAWRQRGLSDEVADATRKEVTTP